MGAAADLAAFGLAGGAGEGGAGEHAVLGGDPAAAGVAQPAGDALLDGGVAEDAGVADLDEDGAFGGADVAGGDAGGAEGGGGAVAGTEDSRRGDGCGGGHEGDYKWLDLREFWGLQRKSDAPEGTQNGTTVEE